MCPTTHHSTEPGDDEEADPEYNVLEEEEEVDAEEMRADRTVQITKKEVSELLSELFEQDFSSSEDELTRDRPLTTPVMRNIEPITDVVQTTQNDIVLRTPAKPTGVVQPLLPTPPPEIVPYTISFPTLNFSPIQIMPQQPIEAVPTSVYSDSSPPVVFSTEMRLLLEEQMRKHVQLLTQTHLIAVQQVELSSVAQGCRSMLNELVSIGRSLDIANVDEAVHLVNYWDSVAVRFSAQDVEKYQRKIVSVG